MRRDGLLFFFFQAEDGIRDIGVTGVQTCALPIYEGFAFRRFICCRRRPRRRISCAAPSSGSGRARSEERRVGKECRSRWATYNYKKKKGNKYGAEQHQHTIREYCT